MTCHLPAGRMRPTRSVQRALSIDLRKCQGRLNA